MKRNQFVLAALAVLALAASACSPGSAGAAQVNQAPAASQAAATEAAPTEAMPTEAPAATQAAPAASQPAAAAAPSGAAVVNVSNGGQLGSFLVDVGGMTLYLFTKDSPGTTTCYDKCATAWPPLLTSGNATAGDGVDASKLGTTTRTDGTTQVTYNGWPLYYFQKDKQPGDTTGQGVGSVWYVISPAGDAMQ